MEIALQKMKSIDFSGCIQQFWPVVMENGLCVILYILIRHNRCSVFVVAPAAKIQHDHYLPTYMANGIPR